MDADAEGCPRHCTSATWHQGAGLQCAPPLQTMMQCNNAMQEHHCVIYMELAQRVLSPVPQHLPPVSERHRLRESCPAKRVSLLS